MSRPNKKKAHLLGFIRSRTGNHDRGSLLDAVTLTVGMALLSWIFLIDPYVRDTTLTLVQKVTSVEIVGGYRDTTVLLALRAVDEAGT